MRIYFSDIIPWDNSRSHGFKSGEFYNMMDRLREGANSIVVKLILGLIILAFVFAGVGNYLVSGSNNNVAEVGSTPITRQDFESAYQNQRSRLQAQMGDYFGQLMAQPGYVDSLRQSVLQEMINDALMLQLADDLGLKISDQQVRQAIVDIPAFQNNGQFDKETYQSALRVNGYTPDSFAQVMRRSLLQEQLTQALQNSEFALPSEVKQQVGLLTQTRNIERVTIAADQFADQIQLSDQEIQDYYQAHQAQFSRPEQFKLSYIEFSAQGLQSSVSVTQQDIDTYYQEHLSDFTSEEQRRVRHILFRGDDAEQQAKAALTKLQAGADFAELAKQESQDGGSADNGGELGWIEKGTMAPEFEQAAFALAKAGDLSGVVKTNFGYHIIQLEEIKAGDAQPLSQVQDQIKQDLVYEKVADQYYDLQNKIDQAAFESPDSLDSAAKIAGVNIEHTDFISQDDLPDVLKQPAVEQALNSDEVKLQGLNSAAIEVGSEHIVVVRVDDSREATVLPLEDVKPQVVSQLTAQKSLDKAQDLATQLVTGLEKGDNSLLAEHQLAFGEQETIDRRSPLANDVFAMKKPQDGQPTFIQSEDQQGNVVVIKLDSIGTSQEQVDESRYADQLTQSLLQQDLTALITALRADTDIDVYLTSDSDQ